jgi:GNAT superfamily N-acetyltransferase
MESAHHIAYADGVPVGTLMCQLPLADNTGIVLTSLAVVPRRRREGIGRWLFGAAAAFTRERGRHTMLGNYCVAVPGGPARDPAPAAFAAAVGVTPALTDIRRRLDLSTVDEADWALHYDEAVRRARGYSLLWWSGEVPDELLTDIAYLEGRLSSDAPNGELPVEPEQYDAERIRAAGETNRLRGEPRYHAAARDDATGRIVGWTLIGFDTGEQHYAWQGTTVVDPAHRGHRLGTLLKLENLRRLRALYPGLRAVDTVNAEPNTHMIAINDALGFRPLDGWIDWRYDVPPLT